MSVPIIDHVSDMASVANNRYIAFVCWPLAISSPGSLDSFCCHLWQYHMHNYKGVDG